MRCPLEGDKYLISEQLYNADGGGCGERGD